MSGTASIPDPYLTALNDDRNHAFALSIPQHPVQGLPVISHVVIFERNRLLPVVLTGLRGIGSSVLAENRHFLLHISPRILDNMGA